MNDVRDHFDTMLGNVIGWLPKLIGFLLILIIGMFVAKLISKAVGKVLERVGFDRAVERGGVKTALAKSDYDASDIVTKVVYWALVLVVLTMAFGVFGPNPVSDVLATIVAFIPKLIVAIIIIVIAAALAAAVRELINNTIGGLSYGKTLANIASIAILVLGTIAALNQIGVADSVTTPVLYALLASIVGVIVVGVGGGLVKPMQSRWEGALDTVARESGRMKEEAAKAPSIQQQARDAQHKVEREVNRADAKADAQLSTEHRTQVIHQSDPVDPTDPTQPGTRGTGRI